MGCLPRHIIVSISPHKLGIDYSAGLLVSESDLSQDTVRGGVVRTHFGATDWQEAYHGRVIHVFCETIATEHVSAVPGSLISFRARSWHRLDLPPPAVRKLSV